MLYVREDIPAKLLSHNFPSAESFFIKINLYKNKQVVNCFCNPHKSNIEKHLDIISRPLDALSSKYKNIVSFGNFDACVDDEDFIVSFGNFDACVDDEDLHAF